MSAKKRVKPTPQEKKRQELERDTVYAVKTPVKAFRKNWPRKKKRAQREHRRAVKQKLHALPPEPAEQAVGALRREVPKKWGRSAMRLADAITLEQKVRASRHGRKKKSQALRARARELGATSLGVMTVIRNDELESMELLFIAAAKPKPAPKR